MAVPSYLFGSFRLQAKDRLLFRNGELIPLTPKAVDTLCLLVENAGSVLKKEEILKQVWSDAFVEEGSLTRTVSMLRKALGTGEEGQEFIATVPRRGYRFVAPVTIADKDVGAPPPTNASVTTDANIRTGNRRRIVLLFASLSLVLIAFVGWAFWRWHQNSQPPFSPIRSVAVLPLENLSGDPSQDYFADGMTEELITTLAKVASLRVISRTSVMHYKGTKKTLPQIAQELNVDALLEGTVTWSGDRVRITANFVRSRPEKHIWAQAYERDLRDVLRIQSDVAQSIATEVRASLTSSERERISSAPAVNPEAYRLYLKGRYFWNKRTQEGFQKGIEFFHQAIQTDPAYAPAYAGLADSYILLGPNDILPPSQVYPLAKAAALKALQIDSALAEAHASLGFVKLLYDWNPTEAEEEFRRSIELDPNYATAHHWYAYDLAAMGRFDEALGQIRRAQELDPLSVIINADAGQIQFFARHYDEAIEQCQKAVELDPSFDHVYWYEGLIYEQKGMSQPALDAYVKENALSPSDPHESAAILAAYHAGGIQGYWQHRLTTLAGLQAKNRYVSPFTLAVVYTRLGDSNKAFENLEKAYTERYPSMVFLKVEPVFDPLRGTTRFQDLLNRVASRRNS